MKKRREQLDLGLGSEKQSGPERTLVVLCANCGAQFVAYYGYAASAKELPKNPASACRGACAARRACRFKTCSQLSLHT
jgi:hypothetical protein